MVWGSSVGWMLFYAALAYGWPCVGYELLPCLVDAANVVAEEHGFTGDRRVCHHWKFFKTSAHRCCAYHSVTATRLYWQVHQVQCSHLQC